MDVDILRPDIICFLCVLSFWHIEVLSHKGYCRAVPPAPGSESLLECWAGFGILNLTLQPRKGIFFFLTQSGWEGWRWPGWQSLDLHLERDKIRHCSKQLTADLSRCKMQMSLECILIISTFCWIDWNANPMWLKEILHSVSKEAGPPWSSISHQHSLHPRTACVRFYSLLGKQLEDLCPLLANS